MSDNICPICLDTIKETNFCVTDCKHKFCLSCLHTSLLNKESCPLCRNDLVPKNKDREELEWTRQISHQQQHQLRDYESYNDDLMCQLDARDILLNQLHEVVKVLSVSRTIWTKSMIYKKVKEIIEGPWNVLKKEKNGPCTICGCKTELDDYGDRICFCDSCQHLGCVDKKNEWRREWTKISLNASKRLEYWEENNAWHYWSEVLTLCII